MPKYLSYSLTVYFTVTVLALLASFLSVCCYYGRCLYYDKNTIKWREVNYYFSKAWYALQYCDMIALGINISSVVFMLLTLY
jgi:hypothetical protein